VPTRVRTPKTGKDDDASGGESMYALSPQRRTNAPLRVLCVGAHSDDIEIGCGGLILDLIRQNRHVEIDWIVFSAPVAREREARRSAALFLRGAVGRRVAIHRFRDGFFPYDGGDIKQVFEELKAEVAPDLVLTHYRDDRHQDHRLLSDLTWNTFRRHLILEYEIPKFDGDLGTPNCFVPLKRSTCVRKVKYLNAVFGTQRDKHWFSEETFMGLMRLRGMECRAAEGYAEAFYARKIVIAT
jgi:LmbE family N-acetylglucosaminyl deacetylase